MTRTSQRGKRALPKFESKEEEAHFWDTHDFTEFRHELKPMKVRFAKNLSQGITIRLDPDTLAVLRSHALEKGVGPTTLARMWIMEHLREQTGFRRTKRSSSSTG